MAMRTKHELREAAEALCKKYNEALGDDKISKQELDKIAEELEQTVNEHTMVARKECFDELLDSADPMLEAVKRLTFMSIKAVDKKVGDDKVKLTVKEITDVYKGIDLLKLEKESANGIGRDPKWNGYVEQLNRCMTVRAAKRLLKNKDHLTTVLKSITTDYKIAKIAEEISLGKDPTSNTKLLGTLQTVINAMIGEEYKATSHDVNFMVDLYASKGRTALSAVCANHNYFRRYIMGICHSIVTGEDYEISFKKIAKKD